MCLEPIRAHMAHAETLKTVLFQIMCLAMILTENKRIHFKSTKIMICRLLEPMWLGSVLFFRIIMFFVQNSFEYVSRYFLSIMIHDICSSDFVWIKGTRRSRPMKVHRQIIYKIQQ